MRSRWHCVSAVHASAASTQRFRAAELGDPAGGTGRLHFSVGPTPTLHPRRCRALKTRGKQWGPKEWKTGTDQLRRRDGLRRVGDGWGTRSPGSTPPSVRPHPSKEGSAELPLSPGVRPPHAKIKAYGDLANGDLSEMALRRGPLLILSLTRWSFFLSLPPSSPLKTVCGFLGFWFSFLTYSYPLPPASPGQSNSCCPFWTWFPPGSSTLHQPGKEGFPKGLWALGGPFRTACRDVDLREAPHGRPQSSSLSHKSELGAECTWHHSHTQGVGWAEGELCGNLPQATSKYSQARVSRG